jgi:hypothetical protein
MVAFAALAVGAAAVGADPPVAPLRGPDEVLAAHNAWADSIGHIWSRAAMMINVPFERKRERYDVDGHFFLEKPDLLFIHGQVLGKEVFRLGQNRERFWFWIGPGVNTVWTARRGGKGERDFAVSPADLMAAWGMFRIDLVPGDAAEFVAGPRHYVLTEQFRDTRPPRPRRRTWFDLATLRPVRVDLFDESGKRLVLAELLAYRPVGQTEVCTVYRARFTSDEEFDLVLRLTEVRPDKKPNIKVFEYRPPPGAKVRNLDTDMPVGDSAP